MATAYNEQEYLERIRSGQIGSIHENVVTRHPPLNGSVRSVPSNNRNSYAYWTVTGRTNRAELLYPYNRACDQVRVGQHLGCKEKETDRCTPKDGLVVSGNKFEIKNEYCITNGTSEMKFFRTTSGQ